MSYPVIEESTWHAESEEWRHTPCGGTVLLGARVYHPIHDGPFPLSGRGDVDVEIVPYCPECGPVPNEHGAPIVPR